VFVRQLTFWILAGMTAVATIGVVAAPNVVHSALALAGALLASAGIFILFGAEFVGLSQILIYVGAVVVLFLFGIMLTSGSGSAKVVDNDQRPVALLVSLGIFGVLAAGILAAFGGKQLDLKVAFPTAAVGQAIFTKWILPFEAVSILLLAAVVGAIVLARKD
jgi:NADH-quinone oxidoreductase subunit J